MLAVDLNNKKQIWEMRNSRPGFNYLLVYKIVSNLKIFIGSEEREKKSIYMFDSTN